MEEDPARRARFADALLAKLGLSSVTTHENKPGDSAALGQTDIYGRAQLSTRNREAVVRALESDPAPETLGQLCASVREIAEGGHPGAAAVLPTLEQVSALRPDATLPDFVGS